VIWLVLALGSALLLYLVVGHTSNGKDVAGWGLDGSVVVAADDSRLGAPTQRSTRLGLVGRPDHLVRSGDALIPVEQKPSQVRSAVARDAGRGPMPAGRRSLRCASTVRDRGSGRRHL
jgi:hypothetical protein